MKLSGKIIMGVIVAVIFLVYANSAFAAIVPECFNKGSVAEMKASPECSDNLNIFIYLAISIGRYLFTFIGALALLFFVYGGFMLIISQGNQEKIKQGTGAMVAAVVGLVIAFSAYALVAFIGNTIGLKAEKGLNFVGTAYAAGTIYCDTPDGCYIITEGNLASCTAEYITQNPCEGIGCFNENYECVEVAIPNCEPCSLIVPESFPVPAAELLTEEVGVKKETDGISAVVKAAQQLNPVNIGKPTDLFARVINALLAFIGSIALVLYIYAGLIWMSSSGNADKVSKAKSILIWTTLGVVAMAGSFMVVRTILDKIG